MNRIKLLLLSVAALFVGGLRSQFATANGESTVGRHAVATTKLADGAFASRHLLVVIGSDDDHVTTCSANTRPWGFTDDQPAAAGDAINVAFLGAHIGTIRLCATGALADGVAIYAAASGQVTGEPTGAGTYYRVGYAKGAAFEGDDSNYLIEVLPHSPVKVVVLAELSSQTTASGSDAGTTQTLANALKADLGTLRTALATPAELKLL